ncbi:MAG TPA: NADP-dependent oxidoreductase [Leadbetterella sp.]|nr:NADP-dependent oxidoreductase [Leadbetterella sp.]
MQNTRILLNQRPIGTPSSECWKLDTSEIPDLKQGEVLLKVKYLSIDPAMRGWMNDSKSYIKPVQLGDVMRALGIAEIVASKNEKFAVGEHVSASVGVQEYVVSDGWDFVKVDPNIFPLPAYLGTLGMSGLTAYFGLLDTGQPKEGETVVVSGAAGAVGSVAGQIAKIKGCRVVGIAGGKDKCDYVVNQLGFDACIDYKSSNLRANLKEVCPSGVDVYFDNVGGEILDTVLTLINKKARIVICGAISQYNSTKPEGPKNYLSLLINRAKMEGIVVFDNAARYNEAAKEMAGWIKEGKLNANFHIEKGGVKSFPDVLMKLFAGENTGKMVLEIDA